MKQTKRILAWILTMTLLLGMLPGLASTAWAAETEETAEPTREETVPVMTEEVTPETTEATVSETAEATVPETTEAAVPETTEATVPETTEETVPETTEETVPETTEETIPEEILTEEAMLSIGTQYGNITFETFADLKYLAAQTYSKFTIAEYIGSENFVFEESLTTPQKLHIFMDDTLATVPEGVTLTLEDELRVGTLDMNGVMYLNGGVTISHGLDISGPLHLSGYVSMKSGSELYGRENIDFVNDDATVSTRYDIYTVNDWNKAIEAANRYSDGHFPYYLNIRSDITLEESASVGKYTEVEIRCGTLRVPAGCTLELNSRFTISGTNDDYYFAPGDGLLLVEGTVVNNLLIIINYGNSLSNDRFGGKLQIVDGGTYRGTGNVQIFFKGDEIPPDAICGLDRSKFREIRGGAAWILEYVGENTGAPGDLSGDGKVNTDDALHLVLHLSFADRFPLHGDGDLNSDGRVNTDDALHLVLHLSFPDRFPLYP